MNIFEKIKNNKGMAMVVVLTACFVVLVTIGIGAAIVANNLEKVGMGSNRERAEINAQSGLERVRGMRRIDGHLLDACSEGDCINTSTGGCGVCASTIYNSGDNRHRVRIETMTAPSIGEDPRAGTITLLSTGYYKNIKRERTATMCLNYCTVAGYNCGNDGCGGQCGTCGVGETCQGGICQGSQTGCGVITTDCSESCNEGDVCGGGSVINKENRIVAIGGGCNKTDGNGCNEGMDYYEQKWDSEERGYTGASDTDNGENNATTLRDLNGGDIGSNYEAAKFCEDLVFSGFDDWYLPAQNEISILDNALANSWINNIDSKKCYWSSTDIEETAYSAQITGGGAFGECSPHRSEAAYFRCLRRY